MGDKYAYMLNLPPVVALAFSVIAGEWGIGEDRKMALTKAGYDYNRIQNCVNELIGIIEKYKG